jgi:hypothetical protein
MPEEVEIRDAGTVLDILIDGEPFAVYNYASQHQGLWHPYFHPVLGPTGLSVTQNGEFPGTLRGHYWHQGLFIAHQKFRVGSVPGNTWQETLGEHGRIRHLDFPRLEARGATAGFDERLEWMNAAGDRVLLRETRSIRIPRRPADRRIMDFEIALEPGGAEAVTFEPTPYHLLACRVANSICVMEQKQEYTRRYGKRVDFAPLDRGGTVINSEGQVNQAAQAAHARWMDFSGPLGSGVCGFAIFNHPRNLRHPTAFTNFTNTTIAAAPTFHEPYALPPGQTLRLRYRVYVHAGDAVAGRVAEEYDEYDRKSRS